MKWISVEDELPKLDKYNIVIYGGGNWNDKSDPFGCTCVIAKRIKFKVGGNDNLPYRWNTFGALIMFGHDVTHWMPLPEAPKKAGMTIWA